MVWRPRMVVCLVGMSVAVACSGPIIAQSASAPAKPSTASSQTPAPTAAKATVNEPTISLEFREAAVDSVLQIFSMASGKTVIKDPGITGNLTLLGKRDVPLTEAFTLLEDALRIRGAVLRVDADTIEVLPVNRAQTTSKVVGPSDALSSSKELVTYILPLRGLDANALRTQLAPLFSGDAAIAANTDTNTLIITDFTDRIARIVEVVGELQTSYDTIAKSKKADQDKQAAALASAAAARNAAPYVDRSQNPASMPQVEVIKLRYANATTLSSELKQILRGSDIQATAGITSDMLQRLKQSGVDSKQAEQLMNQLTSRGQTQAAGQPASVSPLQALMAAPTTQSSSSSSSPILENRVIADTHTNSLIVTGSTQVIKAVSDLVARLDVDTSVPQPEFELQFIPLQYADPRNVAQILNDLATQAARKMSPASTTSGTTISAGRPTYAVSSGTTSAGATTGVAGAGYQLQGNASSNAPSALQGNPTGGSGAGNVAQNQQQMRDRLQALANSGQLKNLSPAERQRLLNEFSNMNAGSIDKADVKAFLNGDDSNAKDDKNAKKDSKAEAVAGNEQAGRFGGSNPTTPTPANAPLALAPATPANTVTNVTTANATVGTSGTALTRGFVVAADTQSGNLIVMAAKDTMAEIKELVKQLDTAPHRTSTMQIISLDSAQPQVVATAITQVFAARQSSASTTRTTSARALPVSGTQNLILLGSDTEIQEMTALAQRLDVAPAGQAMTAVVVHLEHADAANVATVLNQFAGGTRSNTSTSGAMQSFIASQRGGDAASRLQNLMQNWRNDPQASQRLRDLNQKLGGQGNNNLQGLLQGARAAMASGTPFPGVPTAPGAVAAPAPASGGPTSSAAGADNNGSSANPAKPAGADLIDAQGYIRIVAESATNSLLITTPVAALDDLKALIAELDKEDLSKQVVTRLIPLEHGAAQSIANTVTQLYTGISSMSQSNVRTTRAATPKVRLYADTASNLILMVAAEDVEQEVVELVQTLDKAVEQATVDTASWVQELRYADAANVASIITQYLRGVSATTGTTAPVQSSSAQALLTQLRQQATGSNAQSGSNRSVGASVGNSQGAAATRVSGGNQAGGNALRATSVGQMVLVPDTRTSRILISVPKDMEEQVKQLLAELDQPSLSAEYVSRQYQLESAAAASVAQTITQYYNQTVVDRDGNVVPSSRASAGAQVITVRVIASPTGDMLFALLPKAIVSQVDDLVNTIDQAAASESSETATWVQTLKYADATNVSSIINQFLRGTTSAGVQSPLPTTNAAQLLTQLQQRSTQSTTQQRNTQPTTRTQGTAAVGASNRTNATAANTSGVALITPDTRTNRLLISVAKDVEETVRQLLAELDQPALSAEYVTRQYTLSGATASSVAQTINSFYTQTALDTQGNVVPANRTGGQTIQVKAVAGPSGDTLFVLMPTALAARVDELVSGLDKAPIGQGPVVSWVQELKYADPSSLAQVLSTYLRGTAASITSTQQAAATANAATTGQSRTAATAQPARTTSATSTQSVWIVAEPASRRLLISVPQTLEPAVKSLLQELDRENLTSRYTVERMELENADATSLAQTFTQAYNGLVFVSGSGLTVRTQGGQANGWVRVVAEKSSNSLLLIMPVEAASAIQSLVKELDKPGTSGDQVFQVIRLQYADGASVASTLTRIMQGPGGLQAVAASGARNTTPGAKATTTTPNATSGAAAVSPLGSANKTSVTTAMPKALPSATSTTQAATTTATSAASKQATAASTTLGSNTKWNNVLVVAGPDGSSVVVSAPAELVPVVESLVAEFDQPALQAAETRVIPLAQATAAQLATTLTQVFQSTTQARTNTKTTTTTLRIVAEANTNSLVLVGPAADLNRVEELAKVLDKPAAAGNGIRVVALSTAQASTLVTSLNQAYTSLTGSTAAKTQQTQAKTTTTTARTATGAAGAAAIAGSSAVKFFAESGTNAMLIVGPVDELDAAVAFVQQFDHPADLRMDVRRIPLTHANAPQVVSTLSSLFSQSGQGRGAASGLSTSTTRFVSDTGTNSVLVLARAADLDQVVEIIKQLDVEPTVTDMVRLPLANAVASDVVTVLNQVFSAMAPSLQSAGAARTQTTGALRLFAERSTNTVFAVGPKEQLAKVEELVQALDQNPQVGYTVEVLPLGFAKASDIATNLTQAFRAQGGTSRNGVQAVAGVVGTNRSAQQAPVSGTTKPVSGTATGTTNPASGAATGLGIRPTTQTATPSGSTAVQSATGSASTQGMISLLGSDIRFVADTNTNSLLVVAPAELIDTVRDVVAKLDKPTTPSQVRQVALTYASASSVATMITQLYQQRSTGAGSTSNDLRAVADTGTNKLLLLGSVALLDEAEKIAHDLDQPMVADTSGNVSSYRVQNARATDLANVLNSLFSGTNTTAQSKTTNTALGSRLASSGRLGATETGTTNTAAVGQQTANSAGAANSAAGTPSTQTANPSAGTWEGNLAYQNIRVIAEPASNTLLIIGPPEVMMEVRRLITTLDVMPPQVLIEAVVVEMGLDSNRDMGLQWKWNNPLNTPQQTNSGSIGLGTIAGTLGSKYTVLTQGLEVTMSALAGDSKMNVISTPRILAANDTPATINIVTQIPYIQSEKKEGNATTNTWAYKDVGVTLQVTPRIGESGQVYLDLYQTTDSFTQDTMSGRPIINTRETQSTMVVQDGQTLVMGGLIRDNQSVAVQKVPLIGDLPIIGHFFRTDKKIDSKTELVVFVRPTIMRTQADAATVTSRETGRISSDMLEKAGVVTP